MKNIYIATQQSLNRRTFLKASGISIGLPFLTSMDSAFAAKTKDTPRRMVAIETNQGILPQYFFPEASGKNYQQSDYLKILGDHRDQITLFSGVSHPGVDGGHAADKCFLTGTPHPTRGGFKNGISLDQYAAEEIGSATRFPSLTLSAGEEVFTLSYTRSGAPIPAHRSPSQLFQELFFQGNPKQVQEKIDSIQQDRSMLDFLSDQRKRLNRKLGKQDQENLDQYFTSVRDLESRLSTSQDWQTKPKPKVDAKVPDDVTERGAFVAKTEALFDLIKLSIQTDSTRVIALHIDTTVIHNLTHHGFREDVLAELKGHESRQFHAFNDFLTSLSNCKENNGTLLDNTAILYGTCMGSANSHNNQNLPVLLAGGGFKHGQHLAFDQKNNTPLANIFLSILQWQGIQTDQFSTSTGTLTGLELA